MKHALVRTSPKGGDFLGTCTLCGKRDVSLSLAVKEECPNIRGLTEDEALIEIVRQN